MRLIDGRAMARDIHAESAALAAPLARRPSLAVVLPTEDPGAAAYVRGLERASGGAGVTVGVRRTAPEELADAVRALAGDPDVHGILVQAPLPPGVDAATIDIPVAKDVDGMSACSAGRLLSGTPCHVPATADAVRELLRRDGVELRGARAVVVGRSPVAGKPIALALLAADATVTVCHSRTVDLPRVCRDADVLVCAAGRPRFVDATFVRSGATVVDVGINEVDGSIVGDIDTDSVAAVAGALTPVPGGVGPVTTAMLLRHVVDAALSA